MPWNQVTLWEAICDRCDAPMEDFDEGRNILHDKPELSPCSDWRELDRDTGPELVCGDCWDALADDDPDKRRKMAEEERWEQAGPSLIDGGQ